MHELKVTTRRRPDGLCDVFIENAIDDKILAGTVGAYEGLDGKTIEYAGRVFDGTHIAVITRRKRDAVLTIAELGGRRYFSGGILYTYRGHSRRSKY